MKSFIIALGLISAFALTGCKKSDQTASTTETTKASSDEPSKIKVQHILIAFKGTLPGQPVERSKADAEKLAKELLEKAKNPKTDFEALVKEYSSDRPPGVYEMTNSGVSPDNGAFPREQMVPAFGDVGFKLKVGEVGMAEFNEQKSPFGYHIIKRLN